MTPIFTGNGGTRTFKPTYRNAYTVGEKFPQIPLSVAVVGNTGQIKVWNSLAWIAKPVKVWTGSVWSIKPLKFWDGAAWQVTGY